MTEKIPIHVFGSSVLSSDALPLLLYKEWQKEFPEYDFRVLDPNDEWETPDPFIMIDTVMGLTQIQTFQSLDDFARSPTVSLHDFDALFNLRYLTKLGKLKRIFVIGVPPDMPKENVFAKVTVILENLQPLLAEVQKT
jgi:hypothetical protein